MDFDPNSEAFFQILANKHSEIMKERENSMQTLLEQSDEYFYSGKFQHSEVYTQADYLADSEFLKYALRADQGQRQPERYDIEFLRNVQQIKQMQEMVERSIEELKDNMQNTEAENASLQECLKVLASFKNPDAESSDD